MRTEREHSFLRSLFASWGLLAFLSIVWAIATPIGAAPDEPAHLIKAASVARGQLIGAPGPQGEIVQVPQYVAYTHAQTCYAFDEDASAQCIPEVPGDSGALVDAPTTAGLYNPLYYMLVGWPSLLFGDGTGIFAMRMTSAIVSSLFAGLAFALIAGWRRSTLPMVGYLVAISPMMLFLGGTVNPNPLEATATLAAFTAMLTIIQDPARQHLAGRVVILTASAAVAANMRGLSLLWLAVALLAPLLLADGRRILDLLGTRAIRVAIGVTAVAGGFAAAWLLSTNSLGAAIDDPLGPVAAPGIGTPGALGFVWTLLSTFDYAQGIVGIFGWLDTPAPTLVYFTWSLLVGLILLLSFVLLKGRQLIFASVIVGALALLPPLVQGLYITGGGVIWQGRYILPVFVCVVVGLMFVLADRIELPGPALSRLLVAVVALWSVSQVLSFATALRRYATGFDEGWLGLLDPEWTPPGGIWIALGAFVLAVAGSAIAILIAARDKPASPSSVAADH